jgi:hypothetical protein
MIKRKQTLLLALFAFSHCAAAAEDDPGDIPCPEAQAEYDAIGMEQLGRSQGGTLAKATAISAVMDEYGNLSHEIRSAVKKGWSFARFKDDMNARPDAKRIEVGERHKHAYLSAYLDEKCPSSALEASPFVSGPPRALNPPGPIPGEKSGVEPAPGGRPKPAEKPVK